MTNKYHKVINDKRLSFAARGMFIFLAKNEQIRHVSDLVVMSPAGKRHVLSVLQELQKNGYLTIDPVRMSDGKFRSSQWILHFDGVLHDDSSQV